MGRVTRTLSEIRVLTGLLFLGLSLASPAGAVTGYSTSNDSDLVAFDPETGAFTVIGEGPGVGLALAGNAAGELYTVVDEPPDVRLYRVDRVTGEPTLVGDLGDSLQVTSLAFDQGILWLATYDALYTVDPASAALTPIGMPDRRLIALAARDGVLYGLSDDALDMELVRVDTATAATTLVAALPQLASGGLSTVLSADMAFDAQGTLWASSAVIPPVFPGDPVQGFFRIPDAEAPVPELTFSDVVPPVFVGLAFARGPFDPVVEIPTLSGLGGVVLALLLLGGGMVLIRCRSGLGA